MSGPLFAIIPAGLPLIAEPTSAPAPTSFLYELPTSKSFSHITVCMLPGIAIPDNTAAAIYLATAQDIAAAAQTGAAPNFKFLGGIGPGKESAMFKIGGGGQEQNGFVIGISIESADSVGQRLQEMAANKASNNSNDKPNTAVLAQRIIQNAFDFLSSFSGSARPGGVEVVPLKAFENWWRKFESRVRTDPSFLEKQSN